MLTTFNSIKMKLILTSIFVLFTLIVQGQTFMDLNKKELQVDYQKRLDEIALKNKNIDELTANLSNLTKKITDLESEKTTKNREMAALQTKIGSLSTEANELRAKVNSLTEEINASREYINKNTPMGLQNNFSKFVNPSHEDVYDFLGQFEEQTNFELEINGEQPELNRTISQSIYTNGISFQVVSGYEYASYTLFIPIRSTEIVKNGLERLCKNMGGCLSPEEVDISYDVEKSGIKISWEGGC
jgi:outer membrane murein-binding lipoprotein Lpp